MMSNDATMKRRNNLGQELVAVAVGLLVLIPVVLFLFDIAAFGLANQMAETIAKDAVRAAANQSNAADAQRAAEKALPENKTPPQTLPPWITSLKLQPIVWNVGDAIGASVSLTIVLKMKPPVPLPMIPQEGTINVVKKERIVGI